MILIENRNSLRVNYRELLQQLSVWDGKPYKSIEVEKAKTGVPTVKVELDGKKQYLLSKYDPESEAKRMVDKLDEEGVRHVLFIGIGMGYHIDSYMEANPHVKISIYEPNEEILHAFLSNRSLNKLLIQQLQSIFTGTEEELLTGEIQKLLAASNNILSLVTLPKYEKMYGEQIHLLLQKVLDSVKDRHSIVATNAAFQKRWTINSIKNFPTVLKTPNILHDIDRSNFVGKPALIVAAGPSLNEEFENIRYIKENRLAYIFSVGSAINALIEQEIYPDAACTYDPQEINYRVIQRIKDDQITEIPLIFGTSVGFETLVDYPGRMLHMLISQDTIAPALLSYKDGNKLDWVNDAPSIAVVTFLLLAKLGVSDIILVGQNLAYLEHQHYAKGIDYGTDSQKIIDKNLKYAFNVKDVYGNDVKTSDGFNRMRQQLEMYIAANPAVKVWNTTKSGAAIAGTEFRDLGELVTRILNERQVQQSWSNAKNNYDVSSLSDKLNDLQVQSSRLSVTLHDSLDIVQSIQVAIESKRTKTIELYYNQLDDKIAGMKQNSFYQIFLEPMIRVQQERLSGNVKELKYEGNASRKANIIVREFGSFLIEAVQHYELVEQLFLEMQQEIKSIIH